MFRIKICGITNVADALAAADAGADTIGLNFYPQSSRFIDGATALTILKVVPLEIARVGVVVNERVEALHRLLAEYRQNTATGLHAIQLHGDEPPEFLTTLRAKHLIRAGGSLTKE
jgi:phosphoribosylanthranilate isomerase